MKLLSPCQCLWKLPSKQWWYSEMEASSSGCTCLDFLYWKAIQKMMKWYLRGLEKKMKCQGSLVQCLRTFQHQHLQALLSLLSWWLRTPSGAQPASGTLDISCHNICGWQRNILNHLISYKLFCSFLTFRMGLYLWWVCRRPPTPICSLPTPSWQWIALSL